MTANSSIDALFFQNEREAQEALDAALQSAITSQDYERAARALLRLSRFAWRQAQTPLAIEHAKQLLDLPLSRNSSWRMDTFVNLASNLICVGRLDEASEFLREAVKQGDYIRVDSFAAYLEARAMRHSYLGEFREAARDHEEGIEIIATRGDDNVLTHRLINVALGSYVPNGQKALAYAACERAHSIAVSVGLGWQELISQYALIEASLSFGDILQAKERFLKIRDFHANHLRLKIYRWRVQAMLSSMVSGIEEPSGEPPIDAVVASREPQLIAPFLAAYARIKARRNDSNAVYNIFSKGLQELTLAANCWWFIVEIARRGTEDHVKGALNVLKTLEGSSTVRLAHETLLLARLQPLAQERHALEAARLFGEIGWRYHRAVALELAAIPSEARQIYANIGATADAARLRGIRRRRPGRPTRPFGSLTPRQRDILRYIASGTPNGEIATILGITKKTVGDHIGAIVETAGVASREELTVWARSVLS